MRFKIEERYERANENLGSSVLHKPAPARGSERHGLPKAAHRVRICPALGFWLPAKLVPVSDGIIDFQPIHAAINLGLIAL